MKRRTVLRGLAGAGALGLAGCLGSGDPGSGDGTPTDSPTETDESTGTGVPTDEDDSTPPQSGTATDAPSSTPTDSTETPTMTPTLADSITDHEFSATQEGCGTEEDEADVSWDDGESRVTITGKMWGSDLCATARLDTVELADGTLTVRLRQGSTAGEDEMCGNCISEVTYESWFEVDGDLPDRVVVVYHRNDEETTAADESR